MLSEATLPGTKVDDNWQKLAYAGYYAQSPLVLPAMQTTNGGNPAALRVRDVNSNSFKVKVEEETTGDSETAHVNEEIGYLAFSSPGELKDGSGNVIGQVGTVKASQPSDPDLWHRVEISDQIDDPIVFAQIVTHHGGHPVHIRLANVQRGSFFFQLEEWHPSGAHTQEKVAFLAIEPGRHTIDGHDVQAETFSADHTWYSAHFSMSATPVVLTQCQTFNGPHHVVTRIADVDRSGFKTRLQEAEGSDGWHTTERLGCIAVV